MSAFANDSKAKTFTPGSITETWMKHPIPDVDNYTKYIKQDLVVQIPRVMPYCGGVATTDEYIRDVFNAWGLGQVEKCDWKGPYHINRSDGTFLHSYWEVYVYFKSWTDSLDTATFQSHMKSPEKTTLHYDENNYWIINECHNPMSQRERMLRDENRKLKCDFFDLKEGYNETIAYYEALVAQRDD